MHVGDCAAPTDVLGAIVFNEPSPWGQWTGYPWKAKRIGTPDRVPIGLQPTSPAIDNVVKPNYKSLETDYAELKDQVRKLLKIYIADGAGSSEFDYAMADLVEMI